MYIYSSILLYIGHSSSVDHTGRSDKGLRRPYLKPPCALSSYQLCEKMKKTATALPRYVGEFIVLLKNP